MFNWYLAGEIFAWPDFPATIRSPYDSSVPRVVCGDPSPACNKRVYLVHRGDKSNVTRNKNNHGPVSIVLVGSIMFYCNVKSCNLKMFPMVCTTSQQNRQQWNSYLRYTCCWNLVNLFPSLAQYQGKIIDLHFKIYWTWTPGPGKEPVACVAVSPACVGDKRCDRSLWNLFSWFLTNMECYWTRSW